MLPALIPPWGNDTNEVALVAKTKTAGRLIRDCSICIHAVVQR
jgi:hypothetical protein